MNLELTVDQVATILYALKQCSADMQVSRDECVNGHLREYYDGEFRKYDACYTAMYNAIT